MIHQPASTAHSPQRLRIAAAGVRRRRPAGAVAISPDGPLGSEGRQ